MSTRLALPANVRRTDPGWLRALADLDLRALLGRAASQPRLAALVVADAQDLADQHGPAAWPEIADVAYRLGVSEVTARPYIAVAVAAGLVVLLDVPDDQPEPEPASQQHDQVVHLHSLPPRPTAAQSTTGAPA